MKISYNKPHILKKAPKKSRIKSTFYNHHLWKKAFCKELETKPCILLDRMCTINTSITVLEQMPKNAEILLFFHHTKMIFQFRLTANIWGENQQNRAKNSPLLNNCHGDAKADL